MSGILGDANLQWIKYKIGWEGKFERNVLRLGESF